MGNLFKNINEEVRELEGKKTSFSLKKAGFRVQKLLELMYDGFQVEGGEIYYSGSRVGNNQTLIITDSQDHYVLFNRQTKYLQANQNINNGQINCIITSFKNIN